MHDEYLAYTHQMEMHDVAVVFPPTATGKKN
jgi:hypothetical protein